MAKRFTDSSKWGKPFLRRLKTPYKLLWLYILDECDHAGIWQVDFDVAQIKTGEKLKIETAILEFSNRIIEISNGEKWFISDFIDFQYGQLNPANRAHFSVISILKKYNLLDESFKIKGLISPLQGDKDKDKDKDKDMDKDEKGGLGEKIILPFDSVSFKKWWQVWKSYKKSQHKFTYRGAESEQGALKQLAELSENNEETAVKIIEQSIGNGWKGLFKLKENGKNQRSNVKNSGATGEQIRDALVRNFVQDGTGD